MRKEEGVLTDIVGETGKIGGTRPTADAVEMGDLIDALRSSRLRARARGGFRSSS